MPSRWRRQELRCGAADRLGDNAALLLFFFFNDTATTEIYTLSLHDALPISRTATASSGSPTNPRSSSSTSPTPRSEEHTSELQSQSNLVCRLLLEKKKKNFSTLPGSYLTSTSRSSRALQLEYPRLSVPLCHV